MKCISYLGNYVFGFIVDKQKQLIAKNIKLSLSPRAEFCIYLVLCVTTYTVY